MTRVASDVALLAPVPLVHLVDGAVVCEQEGKVAFGSRAWAVFRELDALRKGAPVDVFIYASHNPGAAPEVTWHARYLRQVDSQGGAHPDGMRYRPPSTGRHPSDNQGHWAIFWEVEGLVELASAISTVALKGLGKPRHYGRSFVPEGPLLIEHP